LEKICHACYYRQVEELDKKCPNCLKLYEVSRVNEYIKKSTSTSIPAATSNSAYHSYSSRKTKNLG
jgi:hypothetical protein